MWPDHVYYIQQAASLFGPKEAHPSDKKASGPLGNGIKRYITGNSAQDSIHDQL